MCKYSAQYFKYIYMYILLLYIYIYTHIQVYLNNMCVSAYKKSLRMLLILLIISLCQLFWLTPAIFASVAPLRTA